MGKPYVYDARADLRGGRNTTVNPDLLNATELVDCTNARLSNTQIGAVMKRTGSQRFHVTALPTPIIGLVQWDAPSGKQTVAIAGGNLYYKSTGFGGEFTQVVPGTLFQTTGYADLIPFRGASSGAPLLLFISDGVNLYSWDGTATITLLTGTTNAPAAKLLAQYHTRLFAVDKNFVKNLFWSRVGDGTYWTTGLPSDGGSAMVDVLTGNNIIALDVVGTSLLTFTNYSIARFRGYSSNDIQIAQNTEGVSADVGIVGQAAHARAEQVIAFISERGPYFAVETGTQAYGVDVENDFSSANQSVASGYAVGHHKGRREIWNAIAGSGDGGLNKTVLIYNTRQQNWCGPFTYPFGVRLLSGYKDASGLEWIMTAGSDGFVRHMDVGGLDDVLAGGTGGSAYTMNIELSPMFFGTGPGVAKGLKRFNLQANLPAASAVHIKYAFDGNSLTDAGLIIGLSSTTTLDYRVDAVDVGHRLRVALNDASSSIPIINGLVTEAYNM